MQPESSFTFSHVQYTPLVIGGADNNKQLTNIKPTQTGINRNKWTFWNYKIIGASKKFKNQLHPLGRPGSVNFSQNFWNLSHETVSLKYQDRIGSLMSELISYFWPKYNYPVFLEKIAEFHVLKGLSRVSFFRYCWDPGSYTALGFACVPCGRGIDVALIPVVGKSDEIIALL